MADKKFIARNGLAVGNNVSVIETTGVITAGNTTVTGFANVSSTLQVGGNVVLSSTTGISANGSVGSAGQGLVSNGSAVYWSNNPGFTGSTGPQGTTGFTGSAGAQGAQGPIGFTGSLGAQGPIGFTGSLGAQGPQGAQGPIGFTGSLGAQGPIGFTGSLGAQGAIGFTGSAGPVAGTNTHIVFNDSGVANGSASFTFNKTTGAVVHAGAVSGVTTLAAGNTTITGDVSVSGNLTVSGTRTYVNTTTLDVGDNIITLNADLGAVAPTENAGLEVMRGTSANVQFLWDETNDRWSTNSQPLAISSLVAAGAASGITTLAAGNTTITGFANVTTTLEVGGVATFNSNVQLSAVDHLILSSTSGISANGTLGTSGQGLVSNGSAVFWSNNPGYTGSTGATGFTGSTGAQGPIGFTGSLGAQGPIGFTGSLGAQGPIGFTGSLGAQGPIGFTGSLGAQGPQGAQGPIGFTGSLGAQGPIGFTGSLGAQGPQGAIGFTGSLGAQGLQGQIVYNLPNTGGSASWIKLGTLTTQQDGRNCLISISAAAGYNADSTQNQYTELHFRTSNGASNQGGFYGSANAIRYTALGTNAASPSTIRIVQVNTGSYEFYGNFSSYTGLGSYYTIDVADGQTWTNSSTTVSAPTGTFLDITPSVQIGFTGSLGAQGPQGATGPQGPQGATGPQGPIGFTGSLGAQGPQGATGPQGPAGPTGPQGPIGFTGSLGAQGPAGPTGPQGPQGAQGAQGATGATGPQGSIGYTGSNGSVSRDYTSISGTTGQWFTLFTMSDSTNGPVMVNVKTYAHSSASFIAYDGYGPSGINHIVMLGSLYNVNGGFPNISGVRILDGGEVQIQLEWSSGPTVDVSVTIYSSGTIPTLSSSLTAYSGSGTVHDTVSTSGLNGRIRTENGFTAAAGDVRAPLFYDSDNTGYYIDPNSTSQMVTVEARAGNGFRSFIAGSASVASSIYFADAGNTRAWNWQLDENNRAALWGYNGSGWSKTLGVSFNGAGVFLRNASGTDILAFSTSSFGYSSAYRTLILGDQASTTVCIGVDPVANPSGSFTGTGSGVEVMFKNGAYFISPNSANNSYNNYLRLIDGYVNFTNSARAPIFYDSDNTAFYIDAASTSNINTLNGNGKQMFTTADSYLRMNEAAGFTNGIWMGNSNFGGSAGTLHLGSNGTESTARVRVVGGTYNGSTVITLNGADGIGTAAGSWRAPIFYDSDNTGYYTDPASTSALNGLTVGGYGVVRTAGTINNNIDSDYGETYVTYDPVPSGTPPISSPNIRTISVGSNFVRRTQMAFTYDTDRAWFRRRSDGGWGSWYEFAVFGNSASAGTLYGTIYYDGNDTNFYIDAASTSVTRVQWIKNWGGTAASPTEYVDWPTPALTVSAFGNYTSQTMLAFTLPDDGNYFTGDTVWNFRISQTANSTTSAGVNTMNFAGPGTLYFGPSNYTQTAGSFRAPVFYDSDNTAYYGDFAGTGDSIRAAGNIIAYYSDDRLKTRLGQIENAVQKVCSLNGFYFEANATAQKLGYKAKKEVGISAQEVQAILPELVADAPIGHGYLTVDYSRMVPLLIEAIKEQQTHINKLEDKINSIQNNRG